MTGNHRWYTEQEFRRAIPSTAEILGLYAIGALWGAAVGIGLFYALSGGC